MTDMLRKPVEVLVLAAKLYRELALSASTLLPRRSQRAAVRVVAQPPRLVDVSAS
jgi:hypothetical protein